MSDELNRWFTALLLGWIGINVDAYAQDLPEYRLKAGFLYNFALFTEWPADVGPTLTICVLGTDPFGKEIDGLQGKGVGSRRLDVRRRGIGEEIRDCQVVFIAADVLPGLPRLQWELRGAPVLTVADSPGAVQQGVMLNLTLVDGRIAFEVNLKAARAAGLGLSSQLLRLATEIVQ